MPGKVLAGENAEGGDMKKKLKLYVWADFAPDYRPGLAFAIAHSEEEARKMVEAESGLVMSWGALEVRPLNRPFAKGVQGGG